jgi:hypothetical protein
VRLIGIDAMIRTSERLGAPARTSAGEDLTSGGDE